MTWSAPSERIKPNLPVLSTPVTSAPYILASCTANVPAPPPAPLIRIFCPGWIFPLSRVPGRAITAACGMAAASSNVILAGFSAKALSRAHTYSAKPPIRPGRLRRLHPLVEIAWCFCQPFQLARLCPIRVSGDVVLEAPLCGHTTVYLSVPPSQICLRMPHELLSRLHCPWE